MNTGKRILKNIFSLTAAEMASKGLAFVYSIYLIRKIGPENNGILNFAKSLVQYFLIVVSMGFDQIGIREVAKDKSLMKRYVDSITSIRIAIALISYFALFIIVQILKSTKPELANSEHIIFIYGITIFSNAIMLNWVFMAIEKMELIAIRTLGIYLLNFIGIILLVHGKDDLDIAVVIITASMFVNSVWMFYYYIKNHNIFTFRYDSKEWSSIIRQSFSIGMIFLIATLYNNIDITLLGMMRTDAETGIYGAGHQIIVFAILPSVIIQGAFFPQFSLRNTFEQRDSIISIYARILSFFAYLISGFIFFFSDYAYILLGNEYMNTGMILKFLAFTILLQFIISIYFSPLISWKEEKKVIYANIAGLIMNLILNLLLIPKYGMFGSAAATIFSEFAVLTAIIIIFKNIHTKMYLKEIFEFLPITLISFLPVLVIPGKINPILSGLICLLIYIGISLAFGKLNIKEFLTYIKK